MKTVILGFLVISSFVSCHTPETSKCTINCKCDLTTKASIDTVAKVADSTSFDTLKVK